MSNETPQELIEEASAAYDHFLQQRHEMGEQKYGPVKFMTANTLEEAMAEVVDLGNYARYTFIKLYLLNQSMAEVVPDRIVEAVGSNSFVPNNKEGM